jgi:hypothetical protein
VRLRRRCYTCYITLSVVVVLASYLWPSTRHMRNFGSNKNVTLPSRGAEDDCCLWLKSFETQQPYVLITSLLVLPSFACFFASLLAAMSIRHRGACDGRPPRCMPLRCMPLRCVLLRCVLLRCVLLAACRLSARRLDACRAACRLSACRLHLSCSLLQD